MSDFFDQLTQRTDTPAADSTPAHSTDALATDDGATPVEAHRYTARQLKATAQELLKFGLLEADRKPNLYQQALTQTAAINQILEPLDLCLKVDDIRGLAFLVVSHQLFGTSAENADDGSDDWTHPLVRRQRLTMEQSLLVAILRQHFISHEQEAGLGAGDAVIELEELKPRLQLYLGDTGSDTKDDKRLRNLLESLKNHAIVSDIDANNQVVIRPLITHLANPENLQNLLNHFRKMAGEMPGKNGDTP